MAAEAEELGAHCLLLGALGVGGRRALRPLDIIIYSPETEHVSTYSACFQKKETKRLTCPPSCCIISSVLFVVLPASQPTYNRITFNLRLNLRNAQLSRIGLIFVI